MKVGDVVIMKDESIIRNHWPFAIVEEVFASKDGRVRKVKIPVADKGLDNKGRRSKAVSYLERPIHKLVLLLETQDRGIAPPRSQ